ncbi:MAG: hypothetical protein IPH41_10945 [Sulfuritalea sp.]|nr:hypothetical protein [Sulfuritalea sp.]
MSQKIDKLRGEIAIKQSELAAANECGWPPERGIDAVRNRVSELAESYRRKVGNLAATLLTARTENEVTLSAAVGFHPGAVGELALGMLAAHPGDKRSTTCKPRSSCWRLTYRRPWMMPTAPPASGNYAASCAPWRERRKC